MGLAGWRPVWTRVLLQVRAVLLVGHRRSERLENGGICQLERSVNERRWSEKPIVGKISYVSRNGADVERMRAKRLNETGGIGKVRSKTNVSESKPERMLRRGTLKRDICELGRML